MEPVAAEPSVERDREVREIVLKIVRCLAPDQDVEVTESVDLRDELGYHSLALVELGFLVEDAFFLEPIPRELAELVRVPSDIVDYVSEISTARGFVFEDDGTHVRELLDELAEWALD